MAALWDLVGTIASYFQPEQQTLSIDRGGPCNRKMKNKMKHNSVYQSYISGSRCDGVECTFSDFCEAIEAAIDMDCRAGWEIGEFLGGGATGIVYSSCTNEDGTCGVVKIVPSLSEKQYNMDMDEAEFGRKAARRIPGMAPEIFHICSGSVHVSGSVIHVVLIFQAAFDSTVAAIAKETGEMPSIPMLVDGLAALREADICHGDLHLENASTNDRGQLLLFDWGRSSFVDNLSAAGKKACFFNDFLHMMKYCCLNLLSEHQDRVDFFNDFLKAYMEAGFTIAFPALDMPWWDEEPFLNKSDNKKLRPSDFLNAELMLLPRVVQKSDPEKGSAYLVEMPYLEHLWNHSYEINACYNDRTYAGYGLDCQTIRGPVLEYPTTTRSRSHGRESNFSVSKRHTRSMGPIVSKRRYTRSMAAKEGAAAPLLDFM